MADILDGYTTTEQVASVLGATSKELPEELLLSMGLDVDLKAELYSWLPTHATVFGYYGNSLVTDALQNQGDLLVLFCKYFCAYLVARTLMVSIPQTIENPVQSFRTSRQSADWNRLKDEMLNAANGYRSALLDSTTSPESFRTLVITNISPDTDPTYFGLRST